MPPKMPKVALFDLTVSTKMPGKYGISTLKYLKKIYVEGALRPLSLWGGGHHLPTPPLTRGGGNAGVSPGGKNRRAATDHKTVPIN